MLSYLTEGSVGVVSDDGLSYLAGVEQVAGDDLLFGGIFLLLGSRRGGDLAGEPLLAGRGAQGRVVRVAVATCSSVRHYTVIRVILYK